MAWPNIRSRRTRLVGGSLRDALLVFAMGMFVCFVFFSAVGAFSPGSAVGVTLVMVGVAAVWLARAVVRRNIDDSRDPRLVQARERRGF